MALCLLGSWYTLVLEALIEAGEGDASLVIRSKVRLEITNCLPRVDHSRGKLYRGHLWAKPR